MENQPRQLRLVPGEERLGVHETSLSTEPTMKSDVVRAAGSPLSGVVVGGKYLVGNVIGEGGVGIVYEARNLELDEQVALKCLRAEYLVDDGMVARFAREAKASSRIKSEHVATVYDVGMLPDEQGPFIVMELLQGRDLGAVLAAQHALSARDAVEYTLQACEALAVAHAMGIVHRDIKPDNLMLTERGGGIRIVKVLDFGISKATITGSIFRGEMPAVTTQNLMGTPRYLSPEQVRCSDTVDVRSDIWALGMVLYELVTATTAFRGQSLTEVCAAILEAQPTPLEAYRRDLPSGLVDVVLRCLEKSPERRYQNIAELALALMPFGPKRARINVERAVAVLKASGAITYDMKVESSYPTGSASESSLPPMPRSAPLPGDRTRAAAVAEVATARSNHEASRKLSAVAISAALVVVLAAGGIYWMLPHAPVASGTERANVAATRPAAQSAVSPAAHLPASAGSVPAAEAAIAAPEAPPPSAASGAKRGPWLPPAKQGSPPPVARPALSPTPAARSAEPDLGY